jgi:putative ABC transport system permease protein
MSWSAHVARRLERLDIEPHRLAEITEELSLHLDDRVEELRRLGTPDDEAVRIATAELDRLDLAALARGVPRANAVAPIGTQPTEGWIASLRSDIGYGLRALRQQPGLSLVALVVLAFGIGGSTGIFSVVNAVLLKPLPFSVPGQLVTYWGTAPEKGLTVVNYPDALYSLHSARVRSMSGVAMYGGAGFTLSGNGDAQRLVASNVTSEFFSVLGVAPALGRDFTRDEATRGNNLVTILGHGLWQRAFGGDSSIIGRSVRLNDIPTTVVGVMPSGFDFPNHSELWVPLGIAPTSADCWCYSAIGRLRPGATTDDVAREVDALNDEYLRVGQVGPVRPPDQRRTIVRPLAQELAGPLREPVVILLCAVGAVLVIACANLANLLLARATAREREFAIRSCLGANPTRIVQQLLVEGTLLASGGALAGFLLAIWISGVLGSFVVARLPHLQRVAIDGWVLLFTLGLTALTVVLFGLAPALRSRRIDLHTALRDGARSSRGRAGRRLGNGFVAAQVALSLVLLVSAGLLTRSFRNLLREDAGFDAGNTVVARLSTAGAAYRSDTAVRTFYQRLDAALADRPEFSAHAFSSTAPFSSGDHQRNYFVDGKASRPGEPQLVASVRSVSPEYFRTVGTTVLQGRPFTDNDRPAREPVAVVDESLARLEFPRGDAIGRRVRFDPGEPWHTIVGVVRSIKHGDLARAPDRYVYLSYSQHPRTGMDVLLRTTLTPGAAAAVLRQVVASLDPGLPIFNVHTIGEAVEASVAVQRLLYRLLLAFAVAALALAAIGLYGVASLNVTTRFREFGVRAALGASPASIRDAVLRGGFGLAIAGIGIGLVAAVVTTSFLRTLLYRVAPLDGVTFGVVAVTLALVVLVASYIPARRAMRADPLQALRQD